MKYTNRLPMLCLSLAALATLLLPQLLLCQLNDSPCAQGYATPPRMDPRNPYIICLPEVKRLKNYTLPYVVGDLNHDGLEDWVSGAARKDSVMSFGSVILILIHKGQSGRIPEASEADTLKVTEKNGSTSYLAHGDWDGDGNVDLCVEVQIHGDTSFGNTKGYDIGKRVIFWGDSLGRFSLKDTTQLPPYSGGAWGLWSVCTSGDLDGDGIDDLISGGYGGFENNHYNPTPLLFLYRGHRQKRWGQDGISRQADWVWWDTVIPEVQEYRLLDQDSDGNKDIVFYKYADGAGTVPVSILYGRKGQLPDTNDYQTVDLLLANGHSCLFSDVTGDGILELLVHAGSEEYIKVFIGLKGQRLKEQYGTGIDTARPGQPQWWGKPWYKVALPERVNNYWGSTVDLLYDIGDGDGDGISDIWVACDGYLLMYHTGTSMDSQADAAIRPAPVGAASNLRSINRVHNIDGTLRDMMMITMGGGFLLALPSKEVQWQVGTDFARLPEGTGKPGVGVVRQPQSQEQRLTITVTPNPGTDQIRLGWNLTGAAQVSITDINGKEVLTAQSVSGEYLWQTQGTPAGLYFIHIQTGQTTGQAKVVVR